MQIRPLGGAAVLGVFLLLGASGTASARPDACTTSGSTATCQGNQSAGIADGVDFAPTIGTAVLQNLTTNVTPATGVAGIYRFAQPGSGISSIAATFIGGAYQIRTNGSSAHGVLVAGQGHSGGTGSFEAFESGGTGGSGGGPGSVTARVTGTVTTNGTTAHGVFIQALAGDSGTGGGSSCCNGGTGGQGFGGSSPTFYGAGTITASGDQSSGVSLVYRGGRGGDGGEGGAVSTGGNGGSGGVGPNAQVSATGALAISTTGATNAAAVSIVSKSGDGGNGSFGSGTGGRGGNGGSGVGPSFPGIALGFGDSVGSSWTLATQGSNSHGVFIQGQGGNGGNGGEAPFAGAGGAGGTGGAGSAIFVGWSNTTSLRATTTGASSIGIFAQSIGGNGGSGGYGVFANGGNAGSGGNGGTVQLGANSTGFTATVTTSGSGAHGVLLISQGGTGGTGGSSGVGGSGKNGGGGGGGGSITVNGSYAISTSGSQSHGLAALSLGGTGGKGGDGSFFNPDSGSGGPTGPSGTVSLVTAGTITTRGPEAYGIFAQSVAGHAGTGGASTVAGLVTFGASGGSAGAGGTVSVTNAAAITTLADQSVGLVAQSLGGGGGSGGAAFALFYGQGGGGSLGGAGGSVSVSNSGRIQTSGNDASGIVAQSIGGTGGDGGAAGALVALGGGASGTSNGGTVSVTNSASILAGAGSSAGAGPDPTCGTGCSHGIFAQSIGGGGGNGGSTGGWFTVGGAGGGGGNGATVTVNNTATVATYLVSSNAIYAQSIGGGGGNGGGGVSVGLGVAVAVGGSGAAGGTGGAVTVNHTRGAIAVTQSDQSNGLVAQSIGGGGGTGGFTVSVAGSEYGAAAVSVGGTGGAGGGAGAVVVNTVDSTFTGTPGFIQTSGKSAIGVLAQSLGGGGGNGGFAISVAAGSTIASIPVAVGGKGGVGGDGGTVKVTLDTSITTAGDASHGILAQSGGGGGGHGGFAISGAISADGVGFAVAVGGQGNAGGSAATVDVTTFGDGVAGSIRTAGKTAHGIVAQSVGGGGGHAGFDIAGTLVGSRTGSFSMALGNQGGRGGSAAKVSVTNSGAITTTGDKSIGILAQSLGGGGGSGSFSLALALSAPNSLDMGASLGGKGGAGGNGGDVSVANYAAIATGNVSDPGDLNDPTDNAHGILAQSVGGGGGNGGFAGSLAVQANATSYGAINTTIALGGAGGSGGTGGSVAVGNLGPISTYSTASHGIFAQSVGGGGGAGGSGFAVSFEAGSTQTAPVLNVAFAMGGSGGSGNLGGPVEVGSNGPTIDTYGAGSHGIYAHSVGGGGGSGGSMHSMAYTFNPQFRPPGYAESWNLQVGIGGVGGTGGHGGTVQVLNVASIHTRGAGGFGIYAYSIGGGGGDGGDSAGLPTIPFTDRAKIYKSLQVQVGGSQGASGDGGAVTVQHTGAIRTEGGGAPGIYAHSVGGGGGRGGTGGAGATGLLAIGGAGGAAGNGGVVTVIMNAGSIMTGYPGQPAVDAANDLDGSYGIFAQSVGGGGGQAGNAQLFGVPGGALTDITIGAGIAYLRPGGNGGNGGAVNVQATGTITTYGASAVGIFAQSVGGGGGIAGAYAFSPVPTGLFGSTGGAGTAGPVSVIYSGTMTTYGNGATGIFAQSASGLYTGQANPQGSDVGVVVTGTIRAYGQWASGILAQSSALALPAGTTTPVQGGLGNVTVSLAAGALVQGGPPVSGTAPANTPAPDPRAPAIRLLDGATLRVTNYGTITSADLQNGWAITHDGAGLVTVNNYGTIQGNQAYASPAATLLNGPGGILEPFQSIRTGKKGLVQNDGLLAPAGRGRIGTVQVDARFRQSELGVLEIDLDARKDQIDRLWFRKLEQLDGTVRVNVVDAGKKPGKARDLAFLTRLAGIHVGKEHSLVVAPSAVGRFALVGAGPRSLRLSYDLDFDRPELVEQLDGQQRAVATRLDALHRDGAVAGELMALLAAPDAAAYAAALDALAPEPYAVSGWATTLAALRFQDQLVDCAAQTGARTTEQDGTCWWLSTEGRRFSLDDEPGQSAYDLDGVQLALGVERRVGEASAVGLGIGYKKWTASADGGAWDNNGELFQGGVSAAHQLGATRLTLSLGGGMGEARVRRRTTPQVTAAGDQDLWFLGGQLRAEHLLRWDQLYLKPRADLAVVHVDWDGLDESGAGTTDLRVEDGDDTAWALQPALEAGYEIRTADGAAVRPRLTVGLTQFLDDPSPEAAATLRVGGGAFAATSDVPSTWLDLELGVDLVSAGGVSLGLAGFSQLADGASHLGGTLRLEAPF